MKHGDDAMLDERSTPRDLFALERCSLLETAPPFTELRTKYLLAHGRREGWRSFEDWTVDRKGLEGSDPDVFSALQNRIGRLTERFNVAPWIVEWLIALPRDLALQNHWFPLAWSVRPSVILARPDERSPIWQQMLLCYQAGFRVVVDREAPIPTEPSAGCEFDLGWTADAAAREASDIQSGLNALLGDLGMPPTRTPGQGSPKPDIVIQTHRDDLAPALSAICAKLGVHFRLTEGRPSVAEPRSTPPSPWTAARAAVLLPAGGSRSAGGRAARLALSTLREVLRRAGFDVRQRLRASPATRRARELRLDRRKLRPREALEMAAGQFAEGTADEDRHRAKRTKWDRYRVRVRGEQLGLLDQD